MKMQRVLTEIYAWIATGEDDIDEVPVARMDLGGRDVSVPLLGADLWRMREYRPYAVAIKAETGCRMRLVRFLLADAPREFEVMEEV